MFDLEWSKLALIAVVALVVIGPKDLPRVMRILGQWMQRARAIAREFQGSLDQMVRESELEEMKQQFDRATNLDVEREIHQAIDPGGEIQRSLSDPVLENPLIEPPKPEVAEATAAPAAIDSLPAQAEPLPAGEPAPSPAVAPAEPDSEGGAQKR